MLLKIVPQSYIEKYRPLPEGFWNRAKPGLFKAIPDIKDLVTSTAKAVGIAEQFIVLMMEIEQSAITYAWDKTLKQYYQDGAKSDLCKQKWLLGVDKPNQGPESDRKGAWTGPAKQILGCALRFKFWYRGINPSNPAWANWLGHKEDPKYAPGVEIQRDDKVIVPENQVTADVMRYRMSVAGNLEMADLARKWFPEDFDEKEEEKPMAEATKKLRIVIDPGHGTKGDITGSSGGGVREDQVALKVGLALRDMLVNRGHTVFMTRSAFEPDTVKGPTWRGQFAAAQKANVFVALHLDGGQPAARGCHSFYHNEQCPNGKKLATYISEEIKNSTGIPYSYGSPASTWFGKSLGCLAGGKNWAVTDAATLVEMGFMSNATDLAIVLSPDFPQKAATAILKAIYRYAGLALEEAVAPVVPPAPSVVAPVPTGTSFFGKILDTMKAAVGRKYGNP